MGNRGIGSGAEKNKTSILVQALSKKKEDPTVSKNLPFFYSTDDFSV